MFAKNNGDDVMEVFGTDVEKSENNQQNNQENVHKDQQSMFDAEDVFSESMVVEKEQVEIESVAAEDEMQDDFGDTAEFVFAEKKKPEDENASEELSADELQGSAKEYYNATHSESVEDKIDELRKLANDDFSNEDAAAIEQRLSDFEAPVDKKTLKKLQKQRKKAMKRRSKGYVSDDDMEMLSNVSNIDIEAFSDVQSEKEQAVETEQTQSFEQADYEQQEYEQQDYEQAENAQDEMQSTTYDNPLEETVHESEEERLFEILGGDKKKKHTTYNDAFNSEEPEVEYTSKDQNSVILSGLRSRAVISMVSVVFTFIVTVLCIYFEAASGTSAPHPSVFEPGKFGLTFALSMLQFMFVGIMFNLEGVKRAFLGLRPSRPAAEGFCGMTLCVCTLHTILSCVFAYDSPDLKTYCSVGCISLLLLSINSFIKAYTRLTSFCVAASKLPKYASFELDRNSLEASAFEKYLDKDTTVVTVGKGDFVDGFFKKSHAVPSASSGTFRTVFIVLVVALGTAVIQGVLTESIYSGVCTFSAVSLAALPANALLSTALPFFIASAKAKKNQTAFIGEAACDLYENCGVVSFDDTEVFPKRSVKVSSIRTYGQNRIDKVILYMAKIFDKVEGPLSFVFANSVQNLEEQDVEAVIGEHFSNGICARVDGKEILVGTDEFMRLFDIETTTDNIDESFIQSYGSIMYMSIGGALAAKFYIKYAMNRNFEDVLHAFYDAGICVGIKTLDPCITTELVCGNLKGSNYPVAVIKNHTRKDEAEVQESTVGAVISLSGIHNYLKGFVRLDNLRNVYRTNTIISLFSTIVGIILAVFFSISSTSALGLFFVVSFQLLWCLPTVIFSILSK